MAKVTLNDVTNLNNQTSVVNTINGNSATIETAFENTLSRDGTSPNAMGANLDMNSNRILNLPTAIQAGEPIEYTQAQSILDDAQEAATAAETSETNAAASEATTLSYKNEAATILSQIQGIQDDINDWYLGEFAEDPEEDNDGDPLTQGDLYFNSTSFEMRVWTGSEWINVAAVTALSHDTFSNKSIDLTDNTLTGTVAEFNTAISDGNLAYITTTPTDNTIPKWDSTTGELVDTSIVEDDSGDVSIAGDFTMENTKQIQMKNSTGTPVRVLDLSAAGSLSLGLDSNISVTNLCGLVRHYNQAINSNNFTIDDDGKVGIGVSNPLYALHIKAGNDPLVSISTDDDSLNRSLYVGSARATPTDLDSVVQDFVLNNDALEAFAFSRLQTFASDVSDGTEVGIFRLSVTGSGSLVAVFDATSNAFYPSADGTKSLGLSNRVWSDFYVNDVHLNSGAVLNFDSGDATITHSANVLTVDGATLLVNNNMISNNFIPVNNGHFLAGTGSGNKASLSAWDVDAADKKAFITLTSGNSPTATMSDITASSNFNPTTDDGASLGTTSNKWSDLHLASGGVINFDNGDFTITHSNNALTLAAGSGFGSINYTGNLRASNFIPNNGGAFLANTTAGNTAHISAWDIDGATSKSFITLTSNNTPTCTIQDVTINSSTIGSDCTATTQSASDDSTKLATTAFVKDAAEPLGLATINGQTGTTYTLALSDQGSLVRMVNSSANTVTIPAHSSVAFPQQTRIDIAQAGTGSTTITAASGVTLNGVSAGSGTITQQYGAVCLVQLNADDVWEVYGAIGTVA